ncbi:hypothetical protein PILCRDRAFT_817140 [Piloderma croceum F 1598]|uniref:Uncharacterized protein n=1 Tax=Piloderma croceum (strain F 1598) TaxID=765440 RepID=A0A0C3C690_PILCF|nr:hypothetical protein PILCRDRAFT_817140 [Piloderma croceum F 1598]
MRTSTARLSITGIESLRSRPQLDYLQPSPVRGQLEPYSEKTKAGWRFLQCTDTPDELKVLLPPRTAQIYSELLSAETLELAKHKNASWERILEIRRLKDRMIRKCGRLSRVWGVSGPGSGTLFRTVYAPADFRLKEMEKWIRHQQNSVVGPTQAIEPAVSRRSSTHSLRRKSSFCCERCAATTQPEAGVSHHRRPSVSRSNRSSWVEPDANSTSRPRRSSTSSIHSISIQDGDHRYSQTVYRTSTAIDDPIRNIHAVLEPYIEKPRNKNLPRRRSTLFSTDAPLVETPRVLSPDPLPHPYRNSNMFVAGDDDDSSDTTDIDDARSTSEALESPPEKDEKGDSQPRPSLVHRRSSLKRSSGSIRVSMDATKNVAWAMDQDWQERLQKYEAAAKEAEIADRDWEAARVSYEGELADMRSLRQNLSRTLVNLRVETEKLQREDEVLRDQEFKFRQSYKQLEHTQQRYRAKAQSVLDETRGVLLLCSNKRDGQFGET